MVRCSFSGQESKNCSSFMTIEDYKITSCNYSFMPIEWSSVEENFVSICGDTPWWLPLVITSSFLVVLQLVGILTVTKYLSKIVDPIIMLKMSQNCICITPAWKEDEKEILEPIQKFLNSPTKDLLDETNKALEQLLRPTLINLSIKNGYYEIIEIVVNDLQEPVTKKMIMKAFQSRNVKLIKMLLKTSKERIGNMVRLQ